MEVHVTCQLEPISVSVGNDRGLSPSIGVLVRIGRPVQVLSRRSLDEKDRVAAQHGRERKRTRGLFMEISRRTPHFLRIRYKLMYNIQR